MQTEGRWNIKKKCNIPPPPPPAPTPAQTYRTKEGIVIFCIMDPLKYPPPF
jgi:hypothetical protein